MHGYAGDEWMNAFLSAWHSDYEPIEETAALTDDAALISALRADKARLEAECAALRQVIADMTFEKLRAAHPPAGISTVSTIAPNTAGAGPHPVFRAIGWSR